VKIDTEMLGNFEIPGVKWKSLKGNAAASASSKMSSVGFPHDGVTNSFS